jgi:dihydroxy-acid dehydratase
MIYGGTIRAGKSSHGDKLDIVSAFQSYGGFAAGLINEDARFDIVKKSCPGPGACGGMYTANTMASAIEALGMSLPYSSSTPAEDPLKKVECRLAGRYLVELMKADIKPLDIMKRASFENAMVLVMATGGSTNAVLHLIAMARAAGIDLTLDDFQRVSDRVPFISDLKPSGRYVMEDVHQVRTSMPFGICRL